MCGRTGLSLNKEQVRCACNYKPKNSNTVVKPDWLPEYNDGKEYRPSYNIAPTEVTPILISSSRFKHASNADRVLKPMMWGVIPPWHKGDYKKHTLNTNNCRLENINTSKLYSPILQSGGRCVIVCEGFYEWQTTNKESKIKQPYYIYAPQDSHIKVDDPSTWDNKINEDGSWQGIKLLYIAGLYHVWQDEENIIYSYSVITMNSNSTMDWLHHRMPAILDVEEQIEAWLDIENVKPDKALQYLKQTENLIWHPVQTFVNNAKNKSLTCNQKITLNVKDSSIKKITAWFKKAEKRKYDDITQ